MQISLILSVLGILIRLKLHCFALCRSIAIKLAPFVTVNLTIQITFVVFGKYVEEALNYFFYKEERKNGRPYNFGL